MELHPSTADGSDATFYIAFHSKVFKFSEYCADPIKVSDGNFTVRMGPEDCDFHAASNDKPVKLEFVKYLERY